MVKSWIDAGRPVEFHLYQNGGHGFGPGYLHTSTRIYGETMQSGAGGVPKLPGPAATWTDASRARHGTSP